MVVLLLQSISAVLEDRGHKLYLEPSQRNDCPK